MNKKIITSILLAGATFCGSLYAATTQSSTDLSIKAVINKQAPGNIEFKLFQLNQEVTNMTALLDTVTSTHADEYAFNYYFGQDDFEHIPVPFSIALINAGTGNINVNKLSITHNADWNIEVTPTKGPANLKMRLGIELPKNNDQIKINNISAGVPADLYTGPVADAFKLSADYVPMSNLLKPNDAYFIPFAPIGDMSKADYDSIGTGTYVEFNRLVHITVSIDFS